MTTNMSIADRTIRPIIAITLLIINNKGIISGSVATLAIIISVFFLLTSAAGYCLLYSLFGIRTNKTIKQDKVKSQVQQMAGHHHVRQHQKSF